MAVMVEVDVERLYQQHEQLLAIMDRLHDVLQEANVTERELPQVLLSITEQILEPLEGILDGEESRRVMEDVRLHGAVPLDEAERER